MQADCRIARHIVVMHACCAVPNLQFLCMFSQTEPCLPPQFDDESDVAAVWREVWEESTASSGAGLRLHMAEVVQVRLGWANTAHCCCRWVGVTNT